MILTYEEISRMFPISQRSGPRLVGREGELTRALIASFGDSAQEALQAGFSVRRCASWQAGVIESDRSLLPLYFDRDLILRKEQ